MTNEREQTSPLEREIRDTYRDESRKATQRLFGSAAMGVAGAFAIVISTCCPQYFNWIYDPNKNTEVGYRQEFGAENFTTRRL